MTSFGDALAAVKTGGVACFTGHRPKSFPFGYNESGSQFDRVIQAIDKCIEIAYNNGVRTFISGLALGVDTWAIERVAHFRVSHPDVVIVGAIPCTGQDSRWIPESRDRYQILLQICDAYGYVTTGTFDQDPGCMTKRNVAMLDASDLLIAIYDGRGHSLTAGSSLAHAVRGSGTGHAFTTAFNRGSTILWYNWLTDKLRVLNGRSSHA